MGRPAAAEATRAGAGVVSGGVIPSEARDLAGERFEPVRFHRLIHHRGTEDTEKHKKCVAVLCALRASVVNPPAPPSEPFPGEIPRCARDDGARSG